MTVRFPVPFRDVDHRIAGLSIAQFTIAVNQLLVCGHEHNYAVQGYGQVLWTDWHGAECVQKAIKAMRE